jgi:DhnA family fructose-bisphosphate aldolase class Ia
MADTAAAAAAIAKIKTIMNIIYNNNPTPTPEQILKVMALFDSCHDFGKYSICYDTLSATNRSNTNKSEYKNQRMAFSALSRIAFEIGSDALSKAYGSLRTPAQYYSSALQAKDLENSFMLYAEKYVKDNNKGKFIKREGHSSDDVYYEVVYRALVERYIHEFPGEIYGTDIKRICI